MGVGTLAQTAMKRELNPTRSMETLPTKELVGNEARAALMGSMGGKRVTMMKVSHMFQSSEFLSLISMLSLGVDKSHSPLTIANLALNPRPRPSPSPLTLTLNPHPHL